MRVKMVRPGRLIHTLTELHEEQQILGPQIELSVGTLKVETAVLR